MKGRKDIYEASEYKLGMRIRKTSLPDATTAQSSSCAGMAKVCGTAFFSVSNPFDDVTVESPRYTVPAPSTCM